MAVGVSERSENGSAVIFLDCNGVLIDYADERTQSEIKIKRASLEALHPDRSDSLLRKKAEVNSFSKEALSHLADAVQKISGLALVHFVITSLGDGETLEDLKNFVFADTFFHDSIIDKTVDSEFTYELDFSEEMSPSERCLEKYGFRLEDKKGREIDYWLRENHERFHVQSILIIEKADDSESKLRYPGHVLHMEPGELFSETSARKAHEIVLNYPFSNALFPSREDLQLREKDLLSSHLNADLVSEPFCFFQLNT